MIISPKSIKLNKLLF